MQQKRYCFKGLTSKEASQILGQNSPVNKTTYCSSSCAKNNSYGIPLQRIHPGCRSKEKRCYYCTEQPRLHHIHVGYVCLLKETLS